MSQLNELFDNFLESKPIFKDRRILTISFSPETIPHREKQIQDIGKVLAPALKGGKPSNLFIYGKCGTGKSLVCSYVTKILREKAEKIGKKIKIVHVNCKMKKVADTEYRLMAYLSKSFGKEVPFTGLPTDKIYQEFFDIIDSEEQVIILVIDEIDTLVKKTGDGILYNLTRINEELKKAKLALIGITNDLGFIERLDPRVKSSLSEEEMLFPPYNALQLQDIIKQRAELAFCPEMMEAGVIEKCSALAAQEHGDARKALDLLRVAGELAERGGKPRIEISDVDYAQEKIDTDRVVETVRSQPRQSQAVLYSIIRLFEKGSEQKNVLNNRLPVVHSGDVFDIYNKVCKEHNLPILTQRRISDLIAEFDLFGIISTRVISKGRHGRTRVIELNLSDSLLGKVKTALRDNFN